MQREVSREKTNESGVCTTCGNVGPNHTHVWETTNTVAPTCTTGGYEEQKCHGCGQTQRINETPATGHNFVDGVCTVCGTAE